MDSRSKSISAFYIRRELDHMWNTFGPLLEHGWITFGQLVDRFSSASGALLKHFSSALFLRLQPQ
eukprot:8866964-Heterocapsa_arctica.AAC.1